ncbi:hypothetical protein ACFVP3_29925 [Streptomyces sp. NPDC057806]|uniref:hypothetical protein n=1 Tax=Streptomyces sp. NPDC057806 TaxID=3346255 RepID=UPI003697DA00
MPRGRHRHSPPLHRLLPPSAIAGVSAVCALGPWVFSEPWVLRGLAAAAAATAVVGAVVMRHWDTQAGKRVADLTRARASDEWRFEERVAELETDLEESRELRGKLEQRLRAKRAELAGLRNEHAALLRRYATAETERASALEGRRLLEIEAVAPARALPPAVPVAEPVAEPEAGAVAAPAAGSESGTEPAEPVTPAVFSPEGSGLFLRARAALSKLDAEESPAADGEPGGEGRGTADVPAASGGSGDAEVPAASGSSATVEAPAASGGPVRDETPAASGGSAQAEVPAPSGGSVHAEVPAPSGGSVHAEVPAPSGGFVEVEAPAASGGAGEAEAPAASGGPVTAEASAASGGSAQPNAHAPVKEPGDAQAQVPAQSGSSSNDRAVQAGSVTQEDEAQGKPEAADGQEHTRAAAVTPGKPVLPAQQPAGHFVAPTAVAVVPSAPVRRPRVEGGFDFFGTHKDEASAGLEDMHNEDLADVVGQEALALHKAESEARFKPAGEDSRGVGQVIDLTAHDETEQIDVQGLRSAAS